MSRFGGHAGHHQVLLQRVEQLDVAGILGGDLHRRLDAVDDQGWRAFGLIAEGEHADEVAPFLERGELPGQVLDMHAGAAVDVWGVLVGQDPDAHPEIIVRGVRPRSDPHGVRPALLTRSDPGITRGGGRR